MCEKHNRWLPFAARSRNPVRRPGLARISHHLATTAHDMPQSAAFSRFGVLDVLSSTTPRPSGRKRHISRHLAGLATRRGEIFGLGEVAPCAI